MNERRVRFECDLVLEPPPDDGFFIRVRTEVEFECGCRGSRSRLVEELVDVLEMGDLIRLHQPLADGTIIRKRVSQYCFEHDTLRESREAKGSYISERRRLGRLIDVETMRSFGNTEDPDDDGPLPIAPIAKVELERNQDGWPTPKRFL
jgi:hypothetical protein